jgi:hypothetical protein
MKKNAEQARDDEKQLNKEADATGAESGKK